MKNKITNTLLVTGFAIIVACYFLPLAYGCEDELPNGDMSQYAVTGKDYIQFYVSNFFFDIDISYWNLQKRENGENFSLCFPRNRNRDAVLIISDHASRPWQTLRNRTFGWYGFMTLAQIYIIIISVLRIFRRTEKIEYLDF